MTKYRTLLLVCTLGLLGCGPSKEEQEAGKRRLQDSLQNVVVSKVARISLLKDSISYTLNFIERAKSRLVISNADLAASHDKLSQIKQPQFLRTLEEREEQVRNQTIVIQNLENEGKKLARQIDQAQSAVANLRTELSLLQ